MRRLNEDHGELSRRYQTHQSGLVKEVIVITGEFGVFVVESVLDDGRLMVSLCTASYFPMLELLNQLIAHLDVLVR